MSRRPDSNFGYSTLEVAKAPYEGDAAKEVVSHDAPEALLPGRPATRVVSSRQRIFGLSLRTLILLFVVIVAVIAGAVAGGVVASRSHKSTKGSASPSSTPTSTAPPSTTQSSHVLSDSKLAASNYTDGNGYVHRSVFFQDPSSALIAQLWDSQNKTWKMVNLTEQLPGANILSGTPLTSSSLDLADQDVHVWCLLADQSIHAYYWNGQEGDPSKAQWTEQASVSDDKLVAKADSSLASAWQRPTVVNSTSLGYWTVAYQKPNGDIAVANNSGSDTIALDANAVASSSNLAMIPELNNGILTRLTLTYESNGNVLKTSYINGDWTTVTDETTAIFADLSVPSPASQLATTEFDQWEQILFLALLHNGTIKGNWYDSHFIPVSAIELSGGPDANFSAIATTNDAMFYGVFNDSILEYSINTWNPQIFDYVGVVYP